MQNSREVEILQFSRWTWCRFGGLEFALVCEGTTKLLFWRGSCESAAFDSTRLWSWIRFCVKRVPHNASMSDATITISRNGQPKLEGYDNIRSEAILIVCVRLPTTPVKISRFWISGLEVPIINYGSSLLTRWFEDRQSVNPTSVKRVRPNLSQWILER